MLKKYALGMLALCVSTMLSASDSKVSKLKNAFYSNKEIMALGQQLNDTINQHAQLKQQKKIHAALAKTSEKIRIKKILREKIREIKISHAYLALDGYDIDTDDDEVHIAKICAVVRKKIDTAKVASNSCGASVAVISASKSEASVPTEFKKEFGDDVETFEREKERRRKDFIDSANDFSQIFATRFPTTKKDT